MPVIIDEQEEHHHHCEEEEEKDEHHNHHHCYDLEVEEEENEEEEDHQHHDAHEHHCEEEEEYHHCDEEEDEHPIINNLLLHHTNYKTIDLATISGNNNTNNISVFNCKLVPIHVRYDAFRILFFKQKGRRISSLDTRFLNILFNKIKAPLLQKITQQYPTLSCKNNILLHKEIFSMTLETQIKNIICLDYTEFKNAIHFYNTPYVRIMITILVKTINTLVNIEFIFNIQNKPEDLCEQINQFIFEN